MRQVLLVGFVVAIVVGSGALAFSLPRVLPSPRSSDGSGIAFECENLVEGDRVEIREETEDQTLEIRVEADTRVRAEARFESRDGWDVRREAKLDLCGFVQFVDEDGDGQLSIADTIVRSDLVRFGAIAHRLVDTVHVFETRSDEGNMTVTLRIASVLPPENEPLIDSMVVANPACDPDANHFAVKLEQEEPVDADEFFAAPCGTILIAPGGAPPPSPPPAGFECQALSEGTQFETMLSETRDDAERTLAARVSANTRVRVEARFDNGTSRDWGWDWRGREGRLNLCGILQFADDDGDGEFGPADAVVSTDLVTFDVLEHRVEGGFHTFEAKNLSANVTITIRVPAIFPGPDEPLVQWSVEANPSCNPAATHFAVKVEQEEPMTMERFLVAECGATLSAVGEAG